MDCTDLERLLPAYADGEFASGECIEVEEHLSSCPRCSDEVAALLAFRNFLQEKAGEAKVAAPAHLRERIRRDMSRERAREQVRRFSLYSAVAAGLVVVASFGYVLATPSAEATAEAMLVDAVDKHARALPLEVRATAGSQDVESWFRDKVGFRVRPPTFNSTNAVRLVGARLANVRDREAAYLVYGGEDPTRRTTLLVFPGELELPEGKRTRVGDRQVVMANERGYNVAIWQQRGIVYSLVSDLDERDVLQLVSQLEER